MVEITRDKAISIAKEKFPEGIINGVIPWEGNWLFSIYTDDPDEGELDPFYAVDMRSGSFSGFSIVGDQDTAGIIAAFSSAIEHGSASIDYLAHYGVKGMKWGVRKDRSSSTRKSGPSKTSVNLEKAQNIAKLPLNFVTPRASVSNKLIEVGLAAAQGIPMKVAMKTAATSPMAIAGYAVTGLDSGAYRVPGAAAKNLVRGGWNKDASLAKSNMSVADIQKKVIAPINKDYPGLGTTNNCLRCTYAYEMRRRGNDVTATKTIFASGQTSVTARVQTKSLSGGTKIKNPTNTGVKGVLLAKPPTSSHVMSTLAKQPNGSRGDLQMRWGPLMGGHSVAYEIIGGKPHIFDTQSGKTYSSARELAKLTGPASSLSFTRLDNKSLNQLGMTAWMKDNE